MSENKQKYKILLVEDDEVDQIAFKRFMKSHSSDYVYEIASSFHEASEKLKHEEEYDVMISDYMLGDGTAFDIFELIESLPVIFVTGAGDEEIAIKAMKAGAYDYLIKDAERNYLKFLPITIEKAINAHHNESQLYLLESAIAYQTDISIMITDRNCRIVWVNEGFRKITGFSLEDVKGTYGEKLRKGGSTGLMEYCSELKSDKKSITYESRNYTKTGESYWSLTNLTPITNKHGNVSEVLVVDSDITERKKFEDELKAAKEKAERSEKIKEEFLANMSHEIRTPMNVIIGMTGLLLKTQPEKGQLEYMNAIKLTANNLMVIINDILDFSKIEAGKLNLEKKEFIVGDLLNSLTKALSYQAKEKDLELKLKIVNDLPPVIIGDPVRLNQILLNLINNAIKFTDEGSIEVRAKNIEESEEEVTIEFAIKDTGIGISKDKQKHIFESFSQAEGDTTRKYGGTGLGLAIVKKLVDMQKGELTLESEPRKGATFIFRLPFKKGDPENLETLKETVIHKEEKLLEGIEVLLAEDNELNQMLAQKLFSSWGMEVDIAGNGKIAVEKLKKKDHYDIIFMDIQMPEMDGYQTTEYIRTKLSPSKKHIPIMAMTAHAIEGEREKCLEAGMNDYISKPFEPEKLYVKISKLLIKDKQPQIQK